MLIEDFDKADADVDADADALAHADADADAHAHADADADADCLVESFTSMLLEMKVLDDGHAIDIN